MLLMPDARTLLNCAYVELDFSNENSRVTTTTCQYSLNIWPVHSVLTPEVISTPY